MTADDIHKVLGEAVQVTLEGGLRTVRMADVDPQPVTWLWEPFLPIGKLVLLEGDPGTGKSHVTLAIAAAVSLGKGLPGMADGAPGRALLLTAEDGLADTVRPRLDSMSADVRLIDAAVGPADFDESGFAELEQKLVQLRPIIVVIDPLVYYMGANVDFHRANEVRAITARLAQLAEDYGCVIIAVRHLSKGSQSKAIYRGLGSVDLTAAARSVLLVGNDPDEPATRAIVQTKNNLAPAGEPVGFSMEGGSFRWTGPSDLSAARILSGEAGDGEVSPIGDAKEFLLKLLADGPMLARDIVSAAREAGVADKTLRRAKQQLGVESRRGGEPGRQGGGAWYWQLPTSRSDSGGSGGSLDGHAQHVGPLTSLIPFKSGAPPPSHVDDHLNEVNRNHVAAGDDRLPKAIGQVALPGVLAAKLAPTDIATLCPNGCGRPAVDGRLCFKCAASG